MTERLGISDLMEGGLALLRKNWIAAVLIAGVAGALSIGILWVEGQLGWGLAPVMLLGASTGFLASAAFILVLGNQFRPLLSDPVELFIRCAFGLAAWSIAMVGFAAGLAFLILPGFYLLAR